MLVALLAACACSEDDGTSEPPPSDCGRPVCAVAPITREPDVSLDGCTYASPIAYETAEGPEVLVLASETLTALSLDGERLWSVVLPAPDGEMAFAVATPVLIGDRLIAGYHTVERTSDPHDVNRARERQMIAVIDLAARRIDDTFEPLELNADFAGHDGEVVPFTATNALGRALTHLAGSAPDELGLVYATFGNARDIQPWHGFIFELDLDAWRAHGPDSALRASFVATPEADCGTPGESGSRTRVCGGGMWSPSGPLLVERDGGPELFVSTSNGQLDLDRADYANSILRLRPGLIFDPGCSAEACAGFDPDAPASECVETCRDLFIPRDAPGDPFPWPESGACDGLTMFECWGKLDYIGGSTPAYVELDSGLELLAYPAKDGALYLIDAEYLGTLYDREQLVAVCGTETDACLWDWAGMIVTQPAVTELEGEPLLLVPTFMPDASHPAGVVAVAITETDDGPKLDVRWQAPRFDDPVAIERFRRHPSRIRLSEDGRVAWLVETAARGGRGKLLGIQVSDGAVLVDQPLIGPGYRFTQPLMVGDRIFVPSCEPDDGPSRLEIFELSL